MHEQRISEGVNNHITHATLFTRRAYVTRTVQASVEEGMNRLEIELSALSVERDSLQARLFGEGEIVAVQYQSLPSDTIAQPELNDLDREERALVRQKERLEGQLNSIQRRQKLLDSVAKFSAVQVPGDIQTCMPDIEQLQQLLHYLERNDRALNEEEQTLGHEREEIERQLKRVHRRSKQLRGGGERNRQVIELLFNAVSAQTVRIEASYLVDGAAWEPVYKLDVPRELDNPTLTRLARITQNSGESWQEVELTLSNAEPARSDALPEAWTLQLREAPPEPFWAGGEQPVAAMAAGAEMGMLEETELTAPPEAEYAAVETRRTQTTVDYHLSLPVTFDSGSRESLLPIVREVLEGDFFHYAVPRLDPLVYLVCRIRPQPDWLEGRINLYFDGRYVGGSTLVQSRAGEEMLLNLGPDRAVKVALDCLDDKKIETFFGKVDRQSVARELHLRLSAENLRDDTIRLQLHDSVPVAHTDRFQVKGVQLTPEPSQRDWRGREGVMVWEFELAPGESREVIQRYAIHHPRDTPPYGL